MGHAGDARLDARAEPEVELDIGRARLAVRVPKAAGLEQAGGDRSFLEEKILQASPDGPVQLGDVIVGMIARAFGDDEEIEMILQILADARQIMDDRDADRLQMIGGADARLQQQLGRAHGA